MYQIMYVAKPKSKSSQSEGDPNEEFNGISDKKIQTLENGNQS